jgi:hypothetical protein
MSLGCLARSLVCGLTLADVRPLVASGGSYLPCLSLSHRVLFTDRFTVTACPCWAG